MNTKLNRNHDSLFDRGLEAVRSLFRPKPVLPPSPIYNLTPLPHIPEEQLLDVNETVVDGKRAEKRGA